MSDVASQAKTIPTENSTEMHPIFENMFDRAYWQNLAPEFGIEGKKSPAPFSINDTDGEAYKKRLIREGYIQLRQPGLKTPLEAMTKLFTKIVTELDLPPVFAFMYDEAWEIGVQLREILSATMHDEYALMPAFWAWRVAPGQAGWTPHRDRLSGALFPDNSPKCLTVWVPITEAHPLNGCMYMVPADRDKLYGIDGAKGFGAELSDIRALPGQAGDVFAWTQSVMHWGSHSADDHHLPPRMSVAFEFQRGDVQSMHDPLLDAHSVPSFEQRQTLIAKQILQYTHMYGFQPPLVNLAKAIQEKHGMAVSTFGKS